MNTGALPACADDLARFSASGSTSLGSKRGELYASLQSNVDTLSEKIAGLDEDASPTAQARYAVDVIKPALEQTRKSCDAAERLVSKDLWPFPSYQDILFAHHTGAVKKA